jgi:hypothetical protein
MAKQLRTVSTGDLNEYKIHVIREYGSFRKGLTQSEKGDEIVEYAFTKGWTDWEYLTGQTLKRLGYERPITKWMIDSVFGILNSMTWRPKSDRVWALFIHYWMYDKGPFANTEEVISSLPDHIDKDIAREWTEFFDYRLMASNRTQRLCAIIDSDGKELTNENISENFAKKELSKEFGQFDWEQMVKEGCKFKSRYILYTDIDIQENIPEEQKLLVRKKIAETIY